MPRATAATPASRSTHAPSTHAAASGVARRTTTRASRPAAARMAPRGRCCMGPLCPRCQRSNPPTVGEMADIGSIYAEGRARLTDLLASADPQQHAARVPGCPQWAVRDVIAHVTGVCADVLAGNIAGVGTEEWTAAQVAERKDRSLPEILAEWSEVAPQVEAMAQHFPDRTAEQWELDLTTHEQDIRGALGRPGARGAAGV